MSLSITKGHDLRVLCVLFAYLWMSYCFHALVFTLSLELCYLNIIDASSIAVVTDKSVEVLKT
jgi:hypothetical protein